MNLGYIIDIIGALLITSQFIVLITYTKNMNKSVGSILTYVQNGVLEKLYDVIAQELTDLTHDHPKDKAFWYYIRNKMYDIYNFYSLLKLKGFSEIRNDVLVSTLTSEGPQILEDLGETFSEEFSQKCQEVTKEFADAFIRNVSLLKDRQQEPYSAEFVKLLIDMFRKTVRKTYRLYTIHEQIELDRVVDDMVEAVVNNTYNTTTTNMTITGNNNVAATDVDESDIDIKKEK